MLKIAVCVKIVSGEINPFDACALECALQAENAEVTVLSMGAESTESELLRISRLGVSRVILLTDSRLAGSDTLVTGYALSCALKKLEPDLVMCGRQSIDGDTAQVGPCISEMLGFGLITNVMSIEKLSETVECETRLGHETAKLPAVLTVERINSLRFPRLRSAAKPVERWNIESIGANPERCGLSASPTRVLKTFESHLGARKCRFITLDELDAAVEAALKKNNNTEVQQYSGDKLKSITVIGDALEETARGLAENVKVINETSAERIAELVRCDEAVLWKADLWGRRTAPRVAAMLSTGLCADCTKLETDGKRLLMYRPAFGGTLTAKIECRTRPQMATVRCADTAESGSVIVGVGRGALGGKEKCIRLAERYGAELAASRAAVDTGAFDYSRQVGLTGKSICAKVYIACGISGAVQHTCAIERVGTVIAINPDKNARIFDFADYGIIGSL